MANRHIRRLQAFRASCGRQFLSPRALCHPFGGAATSTLIKRGAGNTCSRCYWTIYWCYWFHWNIETLKHSKHSKRWKQFDCSELFKRTDASGKSYQQVVTQSNLGCLKNGKCTKCKLLARINMIVTLIAELNWNKVKIVVNFKRFLIFFLYF